MLVAPAKKIDTEPVNNGSRVNRCHPASRLYTGYPIQHNAGPKALDKPWLHVISKSIPECMLWLRHLRFLGSFHATGSGFTVESCGVLM